MTSTANPKRNMLTALGLMLMLACAAQTTQASAIFPMSGYDGTSNQRGGFVFDDMPLNDEVTQYDDLEFRLWGTMRYNPTGETRQVFNNMRLFLNFENFTLDYSPQVYWVFGDRTYHFRSLIRRDGWDRHFEVECDTLPRSVRLKEDYSGGDVAKIMGYTLNRVDMADYGYQAPDAVPFIPIPMTAGVKWTMDGMPEDVAQAVSRVRVTYDTPIPAEYTLADGSITTTLEGVEFETSPLGEVLASDYLLCPSGGWAAAAHLTFSDAGGRELFATPTTRMKLSPAATSYVRIRMNDQAAYRHAGHDEDGGDDDALHLWEDTHGGTLSTALHREMEINADNSDEFTNFGFSLPKTVKVANEITAYGYSADKGLYLQGEIRLGDNAHLVDRVEVYALPLAENSIAPYEGMLSRTDGITGALNISEYVTDFGLDDKDAVLLEPDADGRILYNQHAHPHQLAAGGGGTFSFFSDRSAGHTVFVKTLYKPETGLAPTFHAMASKDAVTTSLEEVSGIGADTEVVGIYDVGGRPVKAGAAGLHIVRLSDGTSRKRIIR